MCPVSHAVQIPSIDVIVIKLMLILLKRWIVLASEVELVGRQYLVGASLSILHQAVIELVRVSLLVLKALIQRRLHFLLCYALPEPIG